jgi:hypothetical protein
MKVEILHFEGCPNHVSAMEMVQQVLFRERIEAQIVSLDVPDVETAKKLRFLGSPSIRVNGVDIEPGRQDDPPFFGCRTYNVQGKTVGVPPEGWLADALRSASHK